MKPLVVDCSVTMAWCFEDESSPLTDRVLDGLTERTIAVPPIWPLEVVNVLVVAERRRRIKVADSARFLELLSELPIDVDSDADGAAILATAREGGLSAYDASYIELAIRRGIPLATTDRRLANAAKKLGVQLVK